MTAHAAREALGAHRPSGREHDAPAVPPKGNNGAARRDKGNAETVAQLRDVAHVADVALSRPQQGEQLANLLDTVDQFLGRYVAFPSDHHRWAVAAWAVHTHAVAAFESTPRLAALSPEKGSGKTRLLEALELIVTSPLHTVNVSAAALFRKVSEGACTLLLDEADTYLGLKVAQQHEELRGLINAGHRRGAVAYRCVIQGGVKVEEFPAFAPVALAGIGDLPDTIIDRSIVVAMKRRAPHEHVDPFRRRRAAKAGDLIRSRLAQWAARNVDQLAEMEPEMPGGLADRPADVWEPLIVLGDYARGMWCDRLREAAVLLNKERANRDPSLGALLLADCRRVFGDADRVTTEDLLGRLIDLEESPWGDLRGQPLSARGLAQRLRKFEVRPGDHRFGAGVRKGYLRADFHDAWIRYVPTPEAEEGQQAQQPQPPGPELFDNDAYTDEVETL